MNTHNQYKPRRTRRAGFVPPTLRLQHQVRLPFVKSADLKAQVAKKGSGSEGGVAKSKETGSPAAEGQDVDSRNQGDQGAGGQGIGNAQVELNPI